VSSPNTPININRSSTPRSSVVEDNTSSFTHLDVSNILNEMNISHENEKLLPNGYVADIFIPRALSYRDATFLNDTENGLYNDETALVIEYDGPLHFETYLSVYIIFCTFWFVDSQSMRFICSNH